jgi:hypothetical protein
MAHLDSHLGVCSAGLYHYDAVLFFFQIWRRTENHMRWYQCFKPLPVLQAALQGRDQRREHARYFAQLKEEKMKIRIRPPRGWRIVRRGNVTRKGDRFFMVKTGFDRPYRARLIGWPVGPGLIYIRKK